MDQIAGLKEKLEGTLIEIAHVAQMVHNKGWAEASAGNLSVNVTEYLAGNLDDTDFHPQIYILKKVFRNLANNFILLSRSGSRMCDISVSPLSQSVIIHILEDGYSFKILNINNSQVKPTSELPTHLIIHDFLVNENKNRKAVLHAHINELITISHHPVYKSEQILNDLLFSMNTELIIGVPHGLGVLPFDVPGSVELGNATVKALQSHEIVTWEKHGTLAVGATLMNCIDQMEMISKAAGIYLSCITAGFQPEGLNRDQLNQIIEQYNIPFYQKK